MSQLTLLLLLLSLLAGLTGVGLLIRLQQNGPTPLVQSILYTLLFFNLLIILAVAFHYGHMHIRGSLSGSTWDRVLISLLGLMAALKLGFLYFFLRMNSAVSRQPLTSRFTRRYWTFSTAVLGALVLTSILGAVFWNPTPAFVGYAAFEYLIIFLFLATAIRLIIRFRPVPETSYGKAVRRYGVLHLTLFLLLSLSIVFGSEAGLDPEYPAVFNSLLMFGYNLSLVAWTYRYARSIEATPVSAQARTFTDQVVNYGITQREREIIQLICEGRTNQQIAEELFISVQTVKDHNHNIFRKTAVRNRVELVNLFRL